MANSTMKLPIDQSEIQANTPDSINEEIERHIEANVGYFKRQEKTVIAERIVQLERELDAAQVAVLVNAAVIIVSTGLTFFSNKNWSFLTITAATFAIHESLLGWSPSHALARKLRVRTSNEILLEKTALENLLKQPS